ncbi:hypothetical protein BHU72_04220 [Desulfuribacillus stibiiarsenatis]|uniref:SCP domain-containing protein n=1 Tax=Desulfuribacillus stibiiarsenatis TaxID=1390249 RepID=A0A1E5L587_9FIRM|nr:CAP-associated domain-containing protein [Desulfuribacillus stibiiarsenatis]OEH85307.1 hypothetical protein BHU72_04220 [Desulfuribacillus stibiiarsenatis]
MNNFQKKPIRFVMATALLLAFIASVWIVHQHITVERQRNADGRLSLFDISIGDSEKEVIQRLGLPDRKELSKYGYEWWVYNQDLNRYLQIGLERNRVVTMFSNSTGIQWKDIMAGETTQKDIEKNYQIDEAVTVTFDGAEFLLNNANEKEDRILLVEENLAVEIYFDILAGKTAHAIRLQNIDTLVKSRGYHMTWSYNKRPPSISAPQLSEQELEQVHEGIEKQSFDLINTMRMQNELPLLTWDDELAVLAKNHSVDMSQNRFFNHSSPRSGIAADRLKAAGYPFQRVGENLAYAHSDAIDAYIAWINSQGHRNHILTKEYQKIGIGAIDEFITAKFVAN